ncbi:MAG: glycosyltransferase family 2 protein [Pedobacter sp.]|nr:glycosyltransferase family 2 protein [Pedobacter sp.]MDQ8052713.1 glycosyltransferase family 2 protein [Pedobacter sp.]
MENKKVSIIIPTYKYGHLISETLDCLLNQSYAHWEALIVDDGSEDGTAAIVRAYAAADQRFHYTEQKNQGVSAARNAALRQCSGEFIQFLDADDLLSPEKLKNQVEYLESHPEIDLVLSDTRYFESGHFNHQFTDLSLKNEAQTARIHGKGFPVLSPLIERNQFVIQSPLFKRKMIEEIGLFHEQMSHLEDWDFWLRCAIKNYSFAFLDDQAAIGYVRVHAASASQKTDKLFEAEAVLRKNITRYLQESGDLTAAEKTLLFKKNKKLLVQTFKMLMAKTPFVNFKKWRYFFRELDFPVFYTSFIKALNIKRKSY